MLEISTTASGSSEPRRRRAIEQEASQDRVSDTDDNAPAIQQQDQRRHPVIIDLDRAVSPAPLSEGTSTGALTRANTSSLFIFPPDSKIRKVCTAIHEHIVFRVFILLCILLSAVTLAADQPAVNNPDWLDSAISTCDIIFVVVFLVEAVIKIISMGLVMHHGAYLRSGWNAMDLAIALLSALALLVAKQVKFFRVFRVLRPLRTLQGVPELRNLVVAIFDAIPEVASNLLLFVFILVLFAISGVVLFSGVLTFRCYVTGLLGSGPPNATARSLPLYWNYTNVTLPWLEANDLDICGSRSCQNYEATEGVISACLANRNLYYRRNLNFDQLLAGSLLTLKIMTLDNWNDDMADLMNGVGTWCALWFVLLTFIGAYICVNLFLAILTQSYHHRVKESSKAESGVQANPQAIDAAFDIAREAEVLIMHPQPAQITFDTTTASATSMPFSATASTIVLRPSFLRRNADEDDDDDDDDSGRSTPLGPQSSATPNASDEKAVSNQQSAVDAPPSLIASATNGPHLTSTESALVPTMTRHRAAGQLTSPESSHTKGAYADGKMLVSLDLPLSATTSFQPLTATGSKPPKLRGKRSVTISHPQEEGGAAALNGSPVSDESPRRSPYQGARLKRLSALRADPPTQQQPDSTPPTAMVTMPPAALPINAVANGGIDPDVGEVSAVRQLLSGITCAFLLGLDEPDAADDDRAFWRVKMGKILESILVQSAIAVITLLNVATLAVDYHGIDSDLQSDMDLISLACTVFYFFNFALVLIAFGVKLTFKNGFNVLDFVILLASIPDFLIGTGSTVFSVMRVFRLLRLLRLMRIKKLQPLIRTIIDSVSSIGYLALLILFFVVIFAIAGMQIFGTDFNPGDNSTTIRSSFGTVWQSALAVFIALTGDKWTLFMRTGMTLYSNGGEIVPVFFFCFVYLFGNYILINLSVAIILDSMEEKLSVFDEDDNEEHPPMLLLPRYVPPQIKPKPTSTRFRVEMMPSGDRMRGGSRSPKRSRSKPTTPAVATPVVGTVVETKPPTLGVTAPGSPNMGANAGRRKSILTDFLLARHMQGDSPSTPDPSSRGHTPDGKRTPKAATAPVTARTEGMASAVEDVVAFPGYSFGEVDGAAPPSATSHGSPSVGNPPPESPRTAASNGPMFADQIRDHTSSFATRLRKVIGYFTKVRPVIVEGNSFLIFSPRNPLRVALIRVACSTAFERAVDLIILTNMIFLFFESPKNADSTENVLRTADYVFSCVFALEMLIKMTAFGVFTPRAGRAQKATGFAIQEAYFRDYWNWVDFIVVTFSFLAYVVPLFRASRALRSLRLVTRYETTRIIIVAVIQAIPHVLQGLIFVVFVFFVLGVIGVKFFKGRYYVCNDPTILTQAACIGNFTQTVQGPVFESTQIAQRVWVRSDFHFDNLGSSLLTLFVVTVGDGWGDIMYDGMDTSSDENVALQHFARPYMSLYFVVAYIWCNFFALNMITGVLVSYFSKKKKLHDGSALLTPAQRLYVKARYAIDATLADDLVPREDSQASLKLHAMMTYRFERLSTTTSLFDLLMMLVIVINTVMIATSYEGMPDTLSKAIDVVNSVALAIFIVEMLIKGFTYGAVQYLSFAWNVFDVFVIVIGIIGLFVDIAGLAVLRVIRIFKIIKGTGVERLLVSLVRGAASFINITLLLILTYFVYAVAGVILFGNVKLNGVLTPNYNLQTVPNALLVLYTSATSSGWADVMNACAIESPSCDDSINECGSLPGAVSFFVLFMITTTYVVLQLFVAVVVEIFLDEVNLNDPVIHAFAEMRAIWTSKFGLGVANIDVQDFAEVLRDLPPALTDFHFEPNRADVMRLLGQLNVPIDSHFRVSYHDVVNSLAFRKFKVDLRSMARYLNDTVVNVFGRRSFTATHAYAIVVIQRGWRRRVAYLKQPRPPLTDINTEEWLRRVVARRLAKAERSTASTDSWCGQAARPPPAVNSYSEATAAFVPADCHHVPGSMVYAFPMVREFDNIFNTSQSPSVVRVEPPSTSQNPIEIVPVDITEPPPPTPQRASSTRVRFAASLVETEADHQAAKPAVVPPPPAEL